MTSSRKKGKIALNNTIVLLVAGGWTILWTEPKGAKYEEIDYAGEIDIIADKVCPTKGLVRRYIQVKAKDHCYDGHKNQVLARLAKLKLVHGFPNESYELISWNMKKDEHRIYGA